LGSPLGNMMIEIYQRLGAAALIFLKTAAATERA